MVAPSMSGGPGAVVNVFEYMDYHLFLRDWIDAKKRSNSRYSFQQLANRAGLKSRSFLRLVSMGERDLSHAVAVRLSEAMGLSGGEADRFQVLVGYNNAADPKERELYLNRLRSIRRPADRVILSSGHFSLFSRWYVAPVRELVAVHPFGGDFKALGQMLNPRITSEQAREALTILLDLGLVEPQGDRYRQTEGILHTREELVSRTVKVYQLETMDLAKAALQRVPPDERQIGTLAVGLDPAGWEAARMAAKEFQQKLLDISAGVETVDVAYQINLQMFPLTESVCSLREAAA